MSSVSLNAALTGLKIAQQSMETLSVNVANASTPGYTRKILPQETQVINGQGVGVTSNILTRVVNYALIGEVNKQSSISNYASVQQVYYQRIQDFHGAPTDGTSLADTVAGLATAFTQLSQSPNDPTMLSQTLSAAQSTATKLNSFGTLLNSMRVQTESDIKSTISTINSNLSLIARLNVQISGLHSQGQPTADLEDQRDMAISELSKYLGISTTRDGQSLTVMTRQGQVLADSAAHELYFNQSVMLPSSYYPDGGLSGITIGSPTGTDVTQTGLGGQLGGLIDLRDRVLPQYGAQIDEFAQKLASRFDAVGLKLFTDGAGNVPADVAPPTAPDYVGFAMQIQVNPAVLNNPNLIQAGTGSLTEPAGSSEVINRITQYAFGNFSHQQAAGTVDISNAVPTLYTTLGLSVNNKVTGVENLAAIAPDFTSLPGATLPGTFDITLGALPTETINVTAADTAASLVSQINTAFGMNVASLNSNGQLVLSYGGNITLADGGVGLGALGLSAGTTVMPEPTFQVQVGTRPPVTINIEPTDTSTDLLAKLNAVPGVTASLDPGDGHLIIVPTDGGKLSVVDLTGGTLTALGVTTTNVAFSGFRQSNLGPGGDLSTGLLANSTLQNFISSSIADQSEAASINKAATQQEQSYFTTLQTRNANASGVNIDEEMTSLIQIQSAYVAAAKIIAAAQKMFDDMLNAFPR